MEKILTIVVPTYNMEKYLRHCLDSLIVPQEEMEKFEVLVINDGSKDNSSAIAQEYQDKYPNTFRVIDKENGNYGSCINRGLKEAKGKYIKILDADDSFENLNFSEFIDFLVKSDVDLVVNDYCIVNENGGITNVCKYELADGILEFNEEIRTNFNTKNLQMHAVTYRTKNLRDINYYQTEGISYTDQEWIFLPLITVRRIIYFHKIVYRYLLGRKGQTMSSDAFRKGVSQNQQCVLKISKDFVQYRNKIENKSIANYLSDQALVSLDSVYSSYLIKYRNLDLEGLLDFDQYIISKHILMSMADSLCMPGTRFHYIRRWHHTGARDTRFLFYFMLFYSRVYCHLKRRLQK